MPNPRKDPEGRIDAFWLGMNSLHASIERSKGNGMRCVECGAVDDGTARGWTLHLDIDEELQAFCPECDRREFGNE
jgi:hypothetical protein